MVNLKNLTRVLLLCGISLMSFSCSKTELTSVMEDNESADTDAGLKISIYTPSGDGVVYSRAEVQEESEWKVNSLNLYIFKQTGSGTADTDYVLAEKKEDITLTGGSAGKYSYTHPIGKELINAKVKVVLLANDKPTVTSTSVTLNTTKLSDFKKSLATANVIDNCNSDVLVGGNGGSAKGFPMSGIGKVGSSEEIQLTPKGTTINVDLTRTVARIDLVNKTPNLAITGCVVKNTIDKSYLLPQTTWANPTSSKRITVKAMNDWNTKFTTNGGVAYTTEGTGTLDEKNTLKHVLYLYEDGASETPRPTVEVSYTLTIDGKKKPGKVSVALSENGGTKAAAFFPARNTLYKIQLGDGKEVTDKVTVTKIVVEDWKQGDKIDGELAPGTDTEVGK